MRLGPIGARRKCLSAWLLALVAPASAGATMGVAAEVRVSWPSSHESDLLGYRLRHGTNPAWLTETIDAGLQTTVRVGGLDPDTAYYFAVVAYDRAGNESPPSAELTARIPTSLAPIPHVISVLDTTSNSIYAARSLVQSMRVSGRNLQPGAVVTLGTGVIVDAPVSTSTADLVATTRVAEDAALGPRTVTVVNPDRGTGSATDVVRVVKTPDGNRDCVVDILDLNALARAWNEERGESRYAPDSDLDGDDYVGPNDLTIFVRFLGRAPWTCP